MGLCSASHGGYQHRDRPWVHTDGVPYLVRSSVLDMRFENLLNANDSQWRVRCSRIVTCGCVFVGNKGHSPATNGSCHREHCVAPRSNNSPLPDIHLNFIDFVSPSLLASPPMPPLNSKTMPLMHSNTSRTVCWSIPCLILHLSLRLSFCPVLPLVSAWPNGFAFLLSFLTPLWVVGK